MKSKITIASIFYFLTLPIFAQVNNDDLQALRELYNSTDGANWTNNDGWDEISNNIFPPGFNLGQLYGVGVDFFSKRVISIDLSNNNLVGEAKNSIELLSQVQELILTRNDLSQTNFNFFSALRGMESLRRVDLSVCKIFTIIPLDFWGSPTLENLDVSNNELLCEFDSIPPSIGDMTNLKVLVLGGNDITAKIPNEIGQCLELELISVFNNNMYGTIPTSLGQLPKLKALLLGFNFFTGNLNMFANNSTIESFSVSRNQLTGNLPEGILNNPHLRVLAAANNQLTGLIPTGFWNNKDSLWRVLLSGNQFLGTLPDTLNLPELVDLNLSNNLFTGEFPQQMSIPKIWFFDISSNSFIGHIPLAIWNQSPRLMSLRLHGNSFTGSIPAQINLPRLSLLNISNNLITCNIPSSLGMLSSLTHVYMHNNQLTGGLPVEIGNLDKLETFYVHNNQLSGCLDTTILWDRLCSIDSRLGDNDFDTSPFEWCQSKEGGCGPDGPPRFRNNRSIQSNYWEFASTWSQNEVPSTCDEVIISDTTSVRLPCIACLNGPIEEKCATLIVENGGTFEVRSQFATLSVGTPK